MKTPAARRRLTTRMRLTLTFLALFVGASSLLVTVNYLVLANLTEPPNSPPTPQQLADVGVPVEPGDIARLERLRSELGTTPEMLFVRIRSEVRSDVLAKLIGSSIAALVVAALIAWAVGGRVARAALAPVREITSVAKHLSADNLSERIGHDGPTDELSELADTFDGMLDRLQGAFDAHRSFGSYVSHELLTPLSSLRAEAELVTAEPSSPTEAVRLADITIRQVDRSNELISGLLAISRAEAGLRESTNVDLAAIVGDVVGEVVHLADERKLTLELDFAGSPDELTMSGDGPLLAAMVRNLVRNAAQYNAANGMIDVSLRASGGTIALQVDNTGPVLDATDIAEMAQPFRRLALTRNHGAGHGLGTSVVSAVAALHRGTATWSPRPGGGVSAVVIVPRRSAISELTS